MTDRELLSRAKAASLNAYVPYSRFAVGAALECTDGTVFTGYDHKTLVATEVDDIHIILVVYYTRRHLVRDRRTDFGTCRRTADVRLRGLILLDKRIGDV